LEKKHKKARRKTDSENMRWISFFLLFTLSVPLIAERGYASWYGGRFQGRQTSNGEIFDTNKLTAAHKTLPFNTLVEVTNLNNGRTVEVRINDRGPFVPGRIIDLSRKAATILDMLESGVVPVKLKIIQEPEEVKKILQIASFSQKKNALGLQEKLKQGGFQPRIQKGDGVYRVYIGPFPQSQVGQMKVKLQQAGYSSPLVRSEP